MAKCAKDTHGGTGEFFAHQFYGGPQASVEDKNARAAHCELVKSDFAVQETFSVGDAARRGAARQQSTAWRMPAPVLQDWGC